MMMTLAEIARRDKVSVPAVSQNIHRLLMRGAEFALERDSQGRVMCIDVNAYDLVRAHTRARRLLAAAGRAADETNRLLKAAANQLGKNSCPDDDEDTAAPIDERPALASGEKVQDTESSEVEN